jgi:hypothetical protein
MSRTKKTTNCKVMQRMYMNHYSGLMAKEIIPKIGRDCETHRGRIGIKQLIEIKDVLTLQEQPDCWIPF